MVYDVGRLEEDGQVRVLFVDLAADFVDVVGRGTVFLLHAHQNFAVTRPDGRVIAQQQVDGDDGQADVVEHEVQLVGRNHLANHVFHLPEARFRFLYPRAGGHSQVQAQLAGIHGREEVLADERKQPERADEQHGECQYHFRSVAQGPGQRPAVPGPEFLKLMLETLVQLPDPGLGDALARLPLRIGDFVLGFFLGRAAGVGFLKLLAPDALQVALHLAHGLAVAGVLTGYVWLLLGVVDRQLLAQQVHHQRGHQCPAEDVGGQHGENNRRGQRRKDGRRHSTQKKHRHKHDADGQRGHQRGRGNLLRAIQDAALEQLLHPHVAVNVLDFHRRVVHQNTHGQREAAQGHNIQGLPQNIHDDDADQNREWNARRDNQRGAPRAQKQQNHEGREGRRDAGLDDDALDAGSHEKRLVEQQLDVEAGRGVGLDVGQRFFDFVDDVERAGRAAFQDGDDGGAAAILAHDVGLYGRSLVHEGHVADVHRRAVHRPDGQVVERGNGLGAGVQLDVVFAVADFG